MARGVVGRVLHVLRLCSAFEAPPSALDARFVGFNTVGGVQSHAASLTRALDARGVAQTVITTRPPTAPHVARLGQQALVLRLGLPVPRLRQLYALPAAAAASVAAAAADVVHAHFTLDLGLVPIAVGVARAHDLPLVVTIHCSLRHTLEVTDRRTRAIQRGGGALEGWLERRADAVISLTGRLRERLVADGLDPAKLHVIPSGVEPHLFADSSVDPLADVPRPRITFVGRIEPEKDVSTLLHAAARLRRRAEVIVVGDGSGREEVGRLADELGIADRVHVTGFVPRARIPAFLAHSDVVVHPARMEELGNSVVEAMYAGVPVVVSDVGGIPVAHREDGLRVPAGDAAAFAASIDRVLGDAELGSRLGAAASRRARSEYDWDVLAGRVHDVYTRVIATQGGASGGSISPGLPSRSPRTVA
jgi:glycogen(starch) synthase